MRSNPVKQRLQADEVQAGLMMMSADPHVPGIAAEAGFDFVMTDLEHTAVSLRQLEMVVRAADAAGIVPLTRVAGSTKADILAVLETGVRGIMVPAVESAAEARAVVDAARYAPVGKRGVFYLGYPSEYGGLGVHEHFERSNRDVLVILQIETARGVEAVAEIASVPGYDCLLVGPGDLSASLGVPWQFDHPDLWRAIRGTFDAARAHGKSAGIMPSGVAHAQRSVDAGGRLMLWGPDLVLLQRAAREDVAALRAALPWPARV